MVVVGRKCAVVPSGRYLHRSEFVGDCLALVPTSKMTAIGLPLHWLVVVVVVIVFAVVVVVVVVLAYSVAVCPSVCPSVYPPSACASGTE